MAAQLAPAVVAAVEMTPEAHLKMTRELSALYLRKCAKRLLLVELEKLAALPPMDKRDWLSFIDAITGEYQMMHRAKQWPATVYEIYSPDTPQPRSAEIIEALQFFMMMGHTAIILDSEPWLQKTPWAPDPRKGHTAVLLVFDAPSKLIDEE